MSMVNVKNDNDYDMIKEMGDIWLEKHNAKTVKQLKSEVKSLEKEGVSNIKNAPYAGSWHF